jgi:hypothetical protein
MNAKAGMMYNADGQPNLWTYYLQSDRTQQTWLYVKDQAARRSTI